MISNRLKSGNFTLFKTMAATIGTVKLFVKAFFPACTPEKEN
jgi:hypothetical protein